MEAAPFNCERLGVPHPGEAVRHDRGSPESGQCLAGEVFFRDAPLGAGTDEILRIVQTSDLPALSNTLTPELLAFVRQMPA
jgi:hypothetical protein